MSTVCVRLGKVPPQFLPEADIEQEMALAKSDEAT